MRGVEGLGGGLGGGVGGAGVGRARHGQLQRTRSLRHVDRCHPAVSRVIVASQPAFGHRAVSFGH